MERILPNRGHTYLPNDQDFSHIEKRKDSAVVCIPSDWERVVEDACIHKPFTVKRMEPSEFYDFSGIVNQHTYTEEER